MSISSQELIIMVAEFGTLFVYLSASTLMYLLVMILVYVMAIHLHYMLHHLLQIIYGAMAVQPILLQLTKQAAIGLKCRNNFALIQIPYTLTLNLVPLFHCQTILLYVQVLHWCCIQQPMR